MTEPEVASQLRLNRRVYDYVQFNEEFKEEVHHETIWSKIYHKAFSNFYRKTCGERICNFFPLFGILRTYSCSDVIGDIIAGITMCVFHIPQGLAYGLLAGVTPVNGLYTSFIPAAIYAFFTTSKSLSIGTFSLMSLLLGDFLDRHYKGYMAYMLNSNNSFPVTSNYTGLEPPKHSPEGNYVNLQLIIMVSFIAAVSNLVLGSFRLGFLVKFMSESMVRGFTAAAAAHVATTQIPLILGINPMKTQSMFRLTSTYIEMFKVIHQTHWPTVVTSIICMLALIIFKEFINPKLQEAFKRTCKRQIPIPIELLIIMCSLIFSYYAKADQKFGIAVVGTIPQGLPKPLIPDFHYMTNLIVDAIPLAFVGATLSMSIAKTYALQLEYRVDYNQELIALGLGNVVGSFFQCFYALGALARSSVVTAAGMRSQLSSIVSGVALLLVVLYLGPIFEHVPKCVLGGIIIVSLKPLFMYAKELPKLWKVAKVDFAIWIITCLMVLILDITPGLVVGFAITIFSVVLRTQVSQYSIMGKMPGTEIYEDIQSYADAEEIVGIKIVRYEGPIAFSNAELFKDAILSTVRRQLKSEQPERELHTVILDGSTWSFLDSAGVKVVNETFNTISRQGIRVLFSCVRKSIRAPFLYANIAKNITEKVFYPTTHDAVLYAIANPGQGILGELTSSFKHAMNDEKEPLLRRGFENKRYT